MMGKHIHPIICWTEEMTDFLSSNYTKMGYEELAKIMSEKYNLDIDYTAIARKLGKMGLKKGCKEKTYWTEEAIQFLIDNLNYGTHKELAAIMSEKFSLPITENSIESKITKLGLAQVEKTKWTDEMRQFLAENYDKFEYEELASIMTEKYGSRVSSYGITYQLGQMGLKKGCKGKTYWTEEMVKFLDDNLDYMSYEELAEVMSEKFSISMNENSINHKVTKLGLRRTLLWTEEMDKFLLANYQNTFYPQLATIMSEKFGVNLTGRGVFSRIKILRTKENGDQIVKKPPARVNVLPIGSERDDGQSIRIKVTDIPEKDLEHYCDSWMLKNRYVWEQAYGPIPEDHLIIFLDGDYHNCDLSNLRCVPKGCPIRMISCLANGIFKEGRTMIETGIAWCELSDAIKEARDKL